MRKIKVNGRYTNVPTNWNHINVDKFESVFLPAMNGDIDINTIAKSVLDFDLDDIADTKVMSELTECLEFFNKDIQPNEDPIIINDKEWELTDLNKISYFQAISIENIKKKNNFDVSGYITVLLKPVNEPDFKYEEFDIELHNEVKKLPITHFYGSYIMFYTFMTNMNSAFKNVFKKKVLVDLAQRFL